MDPPGSIPAGSLWYDSETGKIAVYIFDPVSNQWVWATASADCCPFNLDADVIYVGQNCEPGYTGFTGYTVDLAAIAAGGAPPYTYFWSHASNPDNNGLYFFGFTGPVTNNTVTLFHDWNSAVTLAPIETYKVKVVDSRGNITKDFFQVQGDCSAPEPPL